MRTASVSLRLFARLSALVALVAPLACAHGDSEMHGAGGAGGAGGGHGPGGQGGMALTTSASTSSSGGGCPLKQCMINCMGLMKCGICDNDLCTCIDPEFCGNVTSSSTHHQVSSGTLSSSIGSSSFSLSSTFASSGTSLLSSTSTTFMTPTPGPATATASSNAASSSSSSSAASTTGAGP